MKTLVLFLWCLPLCAPTLAAQKYQDRFVWVFGWGLGKDSDVQEIEPLLAQAGRSGCNGAVLSSGLDTLCQQSPDYFRRLEAVQSACKSNGLELIPAIFSIGYGGGVLSHDRNLAEGLPVVDAPFEVHGNEALLAGNEANALTNGSFEVHTGNKLRGYDFHDQPGEISFVDGETKHGGATSLRLENFTANQHGHGRVMQTVELEPHRCYRLTLWAKTEGLQPASAFQVTLLSGERQLAPRTFKIPSTTDWRKVTMLFNSLEGGKVRVYAGVWGGKAGKLWLDDWSIQETGPVNVLHRPGTPVTVRSADGSMTYAEGKDYAPLQNAQLHPWRDEADATSLRILSGSRIEDGEKLRVSWYHSAIVHDSQVTVCMAEPAVYEIFDHEAKLLSERLHPKKVFLNMDEIRMGGTCAACSGRNMGELLGECITRQSEILRRHNPGAQIYVWSDMLDPNHNAHGNYYLVKGDYTGSWRHVPKDVVIAVWGGAPREQSLLFFAGEKFPILVACYYDADDLGEVQGWLDLSRSLAGVRGFMYTPWQQKYALLPEFGKLLNR